MSLDLAGLAAAEFGLPPAPPRCQPMSAIPRETPLHRIPECLVLRVPHFSRPLREVGISLQNPLGRCRMDRRVPHFSPRLREVGLAPPPQMKPRPAPPEPAP